MVPQAYYYLIINLLVILVPLIRSFDHRVAYYRRWRALFPAILITGAIFVVWDVYFTKIGIWGFNPTYLSGISAFGLPLGEWLFFVTVPYACVFIYEVLRYFIQTDWLGTYYKTITWIIFITSLLLGVCNYEKWYTATTFFGLFVLLGIHILLKFPGFLSRFYLSYIVCLIPFFVVNGILTGSGLDQPIVWYNDNENLGIRIFTIPIEDTAYGFFLLLLNTSLFEYFKKEFKT